jgi:hypothetical protein
MRAVVEAAMSPQDDQGKRFHERLCDVRSSHWDAAAGEATPLKSDASPAETLAHLKRLSWAVAGGMFRGSSDEEMKRSDEAMTLARFIEGRLGDRLLLNPAVTAVALQRHSSELPELLLEAWLPEHLMDAYRKWREATGGDMVEL